MNGMIKKAMGLGVLVGCVCGLVTMEAAAEKKVVFYGKIVEYADSDAITDIVQKDLADVAVVDLIQVDWANLQRVLKTGIAAGNPPDAAVYWPQAMKPFVDADQALDLTPYLEANGGEWKQTFVPALLEMGKYNGKYYNVPFDANFSLMIANPAIFEKAGIAIPEKFTWDEFVAASQALKEKAGVFPFACGNDLNNWFMRNAVMSLAKQEGKLEDLAAGKIPATDPLFTTALKNIKALYDNELWYPGQGAMTTTRDEAKAAFFSGKVAMLCEVAANYKTLATEAKTANITAAAIGWPAMGERVVLGGCDGLFIPANAANQEEAVKILKSYTSAPAQKIHADAGFAVANAQVEITDPVTKIIVALGGEVYPAEMMALSAKLQDYFSNRLVPEYILGKSEADIIATLEKLRTEALEAAK